jgi:hypothetical protein
VLAGAFVTVVETPPRFTTVLMVGFDITEHFRQIADFAKRIAAIAKSGSAKNR